MPRPSALLPLAALLLASCASVPVPATRSPESPAHPAAPEAATPPAVPGLSRGAQERAAPTTEAHGHEGHLAAETPGTPQASTYTCPMHPQVTSDKPGACPVCGMSLVAAQKPKDGPR